MRGTAASVPIRRAWGGGGRGAGGGGVALLIACNRKGILRAFWGARAVIGSGASGVAKGVLRLMNSRRHCRQHVPAARAAGSNSHALGARDKSLRWWASRRRHGFRTASAAGTRRGAECYLLHSQARYTRLTPYTRPPRASPHRFRRRGPHAAWPPVPRAPARRRRGLQASLPAP